MDPRVGSVNADRHEVVAEEAGSQLFHGLCKTASQRERSEDTKGRQQYSLSPEDVTQASMYGEKTFSALADVAHALHHIKSTRC